MENNFFDLQQKYKKNENLINSGNNIKDRLIKQTETFKLSLRKKQITKYITDKRQILLKREKNEIEIKIDQLEIPDSIKSKKFTSLDEAYKCIITYIKSLNKEEVKYGLCLLKNYFSTGNSSHIMELYNNNLISDLLDCMDSYINDYSIDVRNIFNFLV